MRIGVTVRFQNSYFSGSIQQVACSISRACTIAGHDVTLLRPKEDGEWFIDVKKYGDKLPPRAAWDASLRFDMIIEVCWSLSPADRVTAAKKVVLMTHYPPIFHDMESCCYMWNPLVRSFENLTAIWMYDFYSKQDAAYLELMSRVPVITVPYVWDADALDLFVEENAIPTWSQSAKSLENSIPKEAPKSLSWCARVVESNFSNTSHCILPLNIISQIRVRADPIRFSVHNGDKTGSNEFFKSNIARNLLLPDISGNMVPRVRLPDLRRDKVVFIAHQRFRPFKSYMLDAMYLGMPMIHNSAVLKNLGAPYYYELNQITQAVDAWNQLKTDYAASAGFFSEKAAAVRQMALRARYSPDAVSKSYAKAIESVQSAERRAPVARPVVAPVTTTSVSDASALRVAFCNMWDQFQPKYNFFMYLLAWIGQQNGVRVVHDPVNPNVVFFGPFSNGEESKYPGVPKVYFTGENSPSNTQATTFLNLGFQYNTSQSYIRLPLWVCEINWWGANVEKVVNPKYVSVKDATTVDTAVLDSKQKFCAFVATNPNNPNRNGAFQALNKWRPVDSGGRLFCNLPDGPIPAGLGGGGGELAKVEFYKKYKFAITFENSSAPGYTTEKLFHAKVAGCVPIYWGDAFVDRDFDSRGFINVNQAKNEEDLISMVSKIADNDETWRKMAAVPAVSEFKRRWCERTMEEVGKRIFKHVLSKDVTVSGWENAAAFGALYESGASSTAVTPVVPDTVSLAKPPHLIISEAGSERIFVTAANTKFIEPAANLLKSLTTYEPSIQKIVYVWPDVPTEHRNILKAVGASEIRELPAETEKPWADFWDVQHFAWKLWVHDDMQKRAPADASVLYLDAGVVIAAPITKIWSAIETNGAFILNDEEQTNERWCHPTFCEHMKMTADEGKGNQITAGLIGFKAGASTVSAEALTIAKGHRDVIVGDKWKPYGGACMGHRHDQSILSLLTLRAGLPRVPLRDFYCDKSMRAAQQWNTPLYVHRGHYRAIVPFTEGIDEAYVINLERRGDRLQRFKSGHPAMKDRTYVWRATDGRALTLTPELVHCFRNNDFKWKKAVMGCALSHLGLWEKLANDSLAKSYLIMEDDVVLDKQWMLKWVGASTHIPKDADVIYLGGVLPPNKPAVPAITEAVNKYFARVAKNTLFGQPARRYFHFCNYAYVLTQSGARKLVGLVKERGVFTSGDHMIVNHGDDLLNIYFTTPFLATCFQEDDPVYQKSEFNNFDRVDGFDSDLWNNKDAFTLEEVAAVGVGDAQPSTTDIWNNFLKQCAMQNRDGVRSALETVFEMWRARGPEDFNKNLSWFRIFEQLILTKNETLLAHKEYILEKIKSTYVVNDDSIWKKVHDALEDKQKAASPAITMYTRPPAKTTPVYHMKQINAEKIFETPWLDSLFPDPIEWRAFETLEPLLAHEGTPVILYQKIPGIDVSRVFQLIAELLATKQKQIVVLHLSDEFANDPIDFYKHPTVRKVLRNYWRPNIEPAVAEKVVFLPLGYAPNRDGAHLGAPPSFEERSVTWSFVGSLDRPGRAEALSVLHADVAGGEMHAKPRWDSPNVMEAEAYNELLRKTKFVPCFRGSRALESYRLYETLEHGGIPIYVKSESADCEDEYTAVLGKHPLLGFADWKQVAENIPKFLARAEVMEKHRRAARDWWTGLKAALRVKVAGALAP
jgi:GR25 family glycosyltransferase involved in LPS biosynthesis